ncbi:MAG: hypothetical protein ACYSW3_02215 [Planctomycetota bacterium]
MFWFFILMVKIDDGINHPLRDFLWIRLNWTSDWYDERVMFNFCTWAWSHWASLDMEVNND